MISVSEATTIILNAAVDLGGETVPLSQCSGRVLREGVRADRDFPPFTRVAMDGIAIRFEHFLAGQRQFPIERVLAAGEKPIPLEHSNRCIEVMTGGVLPPGTDTVIRYEDLKIDAGIATISIPTIKPGQNAHAQGKDRRSGELIIPSGRRLSPAEIGVAATVGRSTLNVARLPKTLMIYTGDELVGIDVQPLPHQIRVSNGPTVAAALGQFGVQTDFLHLPDDPGIVRRQLKNCLTTHELIILSGGISKGKFDYVPEALADLGVAQLIYQIAQRPAKPFWFGKAISGTTVFALPGNPVSAFMCTLRYILPWLRQSLGIPPFEGIVAQLDEAVRYEKAKTYFLQVNTHFSSSGELRAVPARSSGSGDLAGLVDSDGFLELPAHPKLFKKGGTFKYFGYR